MIELDVQIVLSRMLIMIGLGIALIYSRWVFRRIINIPFYCGFSLSFFYVIYVVSGIRFSNGTSLVAEFVYLGMIITLIVGFRLGCIFSAHNSRRVENVNMQVRPVTVSYVFATAMFFILYIVYLTEGNPLLILQNSTELKHYRLNLILVEKDFQLLFFESIIVSLLSIGLVWSIVGHQDDKMSDRSLLLFLLMVAFHVVSTGARSPLIAFFILFIISMRIGSAQSSRIKWMAKLTYRYVALLLILGIAFMSWTTSSRVEYESLAMSVFESYFDVIDFGMLGPLLDGESGLQFFIGTVVVYSASTFNNFIIRYQELSQISPAFGYQFFYPYINFIDILIGGKLSFTSEWKTLSSLNSNSLSNVSDAATQWPTLLGDFIWDFGITFGTFVVLLFGFFMGALTINAAFSAHPSVAIFSVYLASSVAMALVNPFSSLSFHITLILLSVSYLVRKRSPFRVRAM